jgi:hypothetical protein
LTLLVAGVLADDPHNAFAPDHFALLTDLLHARSDLHGRLSFGSLAWVGNFALGRLEVVRELDSVPGSIGDSLI